MVKKKQSGSGLMSSAGLMRYFEAEENTMQVQPKTIVAIGIVIGIAVLGLNAYYRLWPAR